MSAQQPHSLCDCPVCRRGIRRQILRVFRHEPRFLGYYSILYQARLGWVPAHFYRDIFNQMLAYGLLIRIEPEDPDRGYATYYPSCGVTPRKRGSE